MAHTVFPCAYPGTGADRVSIKTTLEHASGNLFLPHLFSSQSKQLISAVALNL